MNTKRLQLNQAPRACIYYPRSQKPIMPPIMWDSRFAHPGRCIYVLIRELNLGALWRRILGEHDIVWNQELSIWHVF